MTKSKVIRLNSEQAACLKAVIKVSLEQLIVISEDFSYDDNVKTMIVRGKLNEILKKLSD